jgi:imidazolonepropionase-like amidohydrolase
MKRDWLRWLQPLMLLLLSVPAAWSEEPRVLAITHATVIDATGAPAQPDVTVVITGDRISALGSSATVSPPTNAVIVDVAGKFLIPGLWDMHVHWYDRDYLPLFIANGVTGIRMMWGAPLHHEWRKEIEQGTLTGPRMFLASTIVDGPKPIWPGSMVAGNADEGRQAVLKAKADGADFVKVYSALPREAYFAIADEAKKQGLPFAGHVSIAVSAAEASAAGQQSIEHLTGILQACSNSEAAQLADGQRLLAGRATNAAPARGIHLFAQHGEQLALEAYSQARADALFAEFKKNHTWQCPTIVVLRNIRYLHELSATNDSRIKFMPAGMRFSWTAGADNRFKDQTTEEIAVAKRIYDRELEVVGAMQRVGVDILAGTDTGNPFCFPGFSLHDELGLLVQAGLTPMAALQAATRNPARFMGRGDLGTIAPGKLADLVLLDADPLADIANTRRIAAVIFGGKLFPKASLEEMLNKIEARSRKEKISILVPLTRTIQEKDVDAAIRQYRELKADRPDAYDFSEGQLNGAGYYLLGMKRTRDAIKILKLNAEMFPQSANVYDSLGEAYMNDGNKELAIENYEKSLQLFPGNSNAAGKLKQLKTP